MSAEARKAQIVAGATTVFADKGYGQAQIADVAGAVGIGHGTVYRYFKDKTDLFREVLIAAVARVGAALEDEPAAADSLAEYEAQVHRIAERLFDLVAQDEDTARLIFEEAGAVREIAGEYTLAVDAFAQMTAEYLENGQKKGFIRADVDPQLAGCAINAMIFEGARRIMREPDRKAALERWSREVVRLFIHGIKE